MAKGIIFDIKEFTVHDGPGIRVTVFFKGCPLRCNWCHNPEGLSFQPQLMVRESSCLHCGRCQAPCRHEGCRDFDRCLQACPQDLVSVAGQWIDSGTLAARLLGYRSFLQLNAGGITISGGEPLAQPEFLVELLQELQPLHTAVETSGYGSPVLFRQVAELADLILFDIKHADPHRHKQYTGVDNQPILANLQLLIQLGKKFIARIPLIPGINDSAANMEHTARLLLDAPGLERVELMPCNPYAGAKYAAAGMQYDPLFDEKASVQIHTDVFRRHGIRCSVL